MEAGAFMVNSLGSIPELGSAISWDLKDPRGQLVPLEALPSTCPNPLCPCTDLRLTIRPSSSDLPALGQTFTLSLDLQRQRVLDPKPHSPDPATQNFADRFVATMTQDFWEQARNLFLQMKATQLQAALPTELKPQFPTSLARDPTLLVSFGIVVPHSAPLLFDLEGETWQAMDDYCVNPPCTCTEAHLTFRAWPQGAPWGPSVHHDLIGTGPMACLSSVGPKWHTIEASPANRPSLDRLVRALEEAYPALRQMLEARRIFLRSLAKASGFAPRPQALPFTPAGPRKVGRNEPCPCGSGKKYKHCCG
jgi:hypothetical protein